jgi:hypothetical protein
MRFVFAVQPACLRKRLPLYPSIVIAALAKFFVVCSGSCEVEDDLCGLFAEILRAERIGWVRP